MNVGAVLGGGTRFVVACGAPDDFEEAEFPTTTPERTLGAARAWLAARAPEAIGIASFGPVDLDPRSATHGRLLRTPKAGWDHVDVLGAFTALAPCAIDTDVGAAARAEANARPGAEPLVYITVGTGVGGAIVNGGETLRGVMHPEIGHLPAPASDPFAGSCPFHGRCVEGVASGAALRARSGRDPASLPDDDPVFLHVAEALGSMLASVALVVSPRVIVLGGGVLDARSFLRTGAGDAMLRHLGGYLPSPPEVAAPAYARPGIRGALLLAVECARAG